MTPAVTFLMVWQVFQQENHPFAVITIESFLEMPYPVSKKNPLPRGPPGYFKKYPLSPGDGEYDI